LPQRLLSPATMENGRQSGLVFGAVFKTVRRPLKSLVCSIRTVFRQPPAPPPECTSSHDKSPKTRTYSPFGDLCLYTMKRGRSVPRQGPPPPSGKGLRSYYPDFPLLASRPPCRR